MVTWRSAVEGGEKHLWMECLAGSGRLTTATDIRCERELTVAKQRPRPRQAADDETAADEKQDGDTI